MARIKHSELATQLVIEGALGVFGGKELKGQLPVTPHVLSDREAQDVGLPPGGTVLYYPIDSKGVFFDMVGSRAIVWYSGADADRALSLFDSELKRAYPSAKQLVDTAHPDASEMRIRAYDVKLADGMMATVEVSYSKQGVSPPKFSAQVVAMAIKN